MTVLLTSAGRRTSLLRAFQEAVRDTGGCVWAGDADPLSPTLQIADEHAVLPLVDDDTYVSTLVDLVDTHDIDLVLSLIDPELQVLATAAPALREAGCHALVSTSSVLDLAADKWETLQYFKDLGIRTPATWLPARSSPSDWPNPVFIKPRKGSASTDARAVEKGQASSVLSRLETPLLQEVVDAPEMTVDALFDLDGTLIHYVPRLRLRTQAGESIQGRTLPDDTIGRWLRRVLRELGRLGARGPVTLQGFCTEPEPTLSEVNPRFGGGFPLARAAGGRYPSWIVQMCNGNAPSPRLGEYTEGLCMTRAYTEWFVEASSLNSDY
jgi:carbamoyl-phosphate synthase large subunit